MGDLRINPGGRVHTARLMQFTDRNGYADAPFASGVADGTQVWTWSGHATGLSGVDAADLMETFKARCLDGAWGAGFAFDGTAFPDAVILDMMFVRTTITGYALCITFAGTPVPCYTAGVLSVVPPPVGPQFRSWEQQCSAGGDATVKLPVGSVGDLLVWCINADSGFTDPVGWNVALVEFQGQKLGVYWRIADGTEPAMLTTPLFVNPSDFATFCLRYWNTDAVSPVGSVGGLNPATPQGPISITMDTAPIVTTKANSIALFVCAPNDETGSAITGYFHVAVLTSTFLTTPIETDFSSIFGGTTDVVPVFGSNPFSPFVHLASASLAGAAIMQGYCSISIEIKGA